MPTSPQLPSGSIRRFIKSIIYLKEKGKSIKEWGHILPLTQARRLGYFLLWERERAMDLAAGYILGNYRLVALGEREKGLEWARRARAIAPEQPMLLYNLG